MAWTRVIAQTWWEMGRNGYIEKIRLTEFPDRLDVGGSVGNGADVCQECHEGFWSEQLEARLNSEFCLGLLLQTS